MTKFTPNFELNPTTFNIFDTVQFRKFIIDNNVSATIVAFTIAGNMNRLIDSLYDNVLFTCEREHLKKNESSEKKCLSNFDYLKTKKFIYNNYYIYYGTFIIDFLKFIISIIIAFYLSRFINDLFD